MNQAVLFINKDTNVVYLISKSLPINKGDCYLDMSLADEDYPTKAYTCKRLPGDSLNAANGCFKILATSDENLKMPMPEYLYF